MHKFFIQLEFNETCLLEGKQLLLRGSVFPYRISLRRFLLFSCLQRGFHIVVLIVLINLFVKHTRYINFNDGINQLQAEKNTGKIIHNFPTKSILSITLLQIEKNKQTLK